LAEIARGELRPPEAEGELQDVIALAVTHHGRRQYAPGAGVAHRAAFVTNERSGPFAAPSLTEFDLLYRYRPCGGVVILADQIASALQDGRAGVLVSVDP